MTLGRARIDVCGCSEFLFLSDLIGFSCLSSLARSTARSLPRRQAWRPECGLCAGPRSTQGSKGRDHNPYVFTNWLCGGGTRGGVTAGQSDEWGYKPLDRANPTQVYDIHATMLHLLGIDHKQLTVRHNGIDRRLTDVHGHVVNDLLA